MVWEIAFYAERVGSAERSEPLDLLVPLGVTLAVIAESFDNLAIRCGPTAASFGDTLQLGFQKCELRDALSDQRKLRFGDFVGRRTIHRWGGLELQHLTNGIQREAEMARMLYEADALDIIFPIHSLPAGAALGLCH